MTIAKIFEYARETPDKTAVVYNGVRLSYAAFAQRIEGTRRFLAQRDLPVGSVAVICIENLLDGWIVGFALRSLGVTTIVATDADESVERGPGEIGHIVIGAAGRRPEPADALASRGLLSIPIPEGLGQRGERAVPAAPPVVGRGGGHILMTSGTTGASKMVVRDAVTEAIALPLHAEINAISEHSIVYVANFGLGTGGGYRWPLITWSVGGTVVIHQADDLREPLVQHELTHIFMTPNMLTALLREDGGAPRRNDASRLLVTGGALSKAMWMAAAKLLTDQVFSVLASTEALTLAVTPIRGADDLLWHRIHPSREVEVVDETGKVLEPGQIGLVRSRIIDGLAGYLDDEVATKEFFRDGYFYSGDLGLVGPDGRVALRGRASDVVNVFGTKVATEPIERKLRDRLGVDGVCVVSIPGADLDQEIHVVIESARRVEPAELQAAASDELAVFGNILLHVSFATLPRNANGKVARLVLKDRLIRARPRGARADAR